MDAGSFSGVSLDFKTQLDKASKDKRISNSELQTLNKVAETDTDRQIVRALAEGDETKEKLEFTIESQSGNADASYKLSIDDNKFDLDDAGNLKQVVTTKSNKKIEITFSNSPLPRNQVVGSIDDANAKLEELIPEDKLSKWNSLNKHDISSVKSFINSLNLSVEDKVSFVENYLTAFYDHPGEDVVWNQKAGLQESINAVPSDKHGRKYVDCEGYAGIAMELLGSKDNPAKAYVVDSNSTNKGERDHQVAVYNEGNTAYVISNNQIKAMDLSTYKTNEKAIEKAFGFSMVKEDKSGPMKTGVGEWDIGETYTMKQGGKLKVSSIDEDTGVLTGSYKSPDGETYKVEGRVNDQGMLQTKRIYEAGDVINLKSGESIEIKEIDQKSGTFTATVTDNDNNVKTAKYKLKEDGGFDFQSWKISQGDKFNLNFGKSGNYDFEINEVVTDGKKFKVTVTDENYNTWEATLTKRGNSYNFSPRTPPAEE